MTTGKADTTWFSAETILKCLITPIGIAGCGMIALGSGIARFDPELGDIADAVVPFEYLGIPRLPFFGLLGAMKVLAVSSEWGYGPFPKWFARIGLMLCCLCAGIGHTVVGKSAVPPLIFLTLIACLFAFDAREISRKGTASFEYDYPKKD